MSAKIRNGGGVEYHCFAEGYARTDGRFDVRLAFSLPDESEVHRTPALEIVEAGEDALAAWAHALSTERLADALHEVLAEKVPRDG
ncbi:MAG: hypothetical protein ACRD2J_15820 [Thermoanaerobaculia bacterium]